ncbi:MAG TPA: DinB family protein [Holophagaceae bacterium]|jgi:uncharacterized damage-inducible protein DinB|nr:DinB family protein [Holophagaceae bacterium]
MDRELALLVDNLDKAFNRRSWHGTNLRGALRGLTLETASRRPGKGRPSIWELALHCAYWKHTVLNRIQGGKRVSFPLEGSNWFPRSPKDGASRLKADLALLTKIHRELRETVASLSPKDLDRKAGRWTWRETILGAAAHDLHHAGQMQLIKRMKSL